MNRHDMTLIGKLEGSWNSFTPAVLKEVAEYIQERLIEDDTARERAAQLEGEKEYLARLRAREEVREQLRREASSEAERARRRAAASKGVQARRAKLTAPQ